MHACLCIHPARIGQRTVSLLHLRHYQLQDIILIRLFYPSPTR